MATTEQLMSFYPRQQWLQPGFLSLSSLLLLTVPSLLGYCCQFVDASAIFVGSGREDGAISVSRSLIPPQQQRAPNPFDPFFSVLSQKNSKSREKLNLLLLKKRKLQQEEEENPILGRNITDVVDDLLARSDTNEKGDASNTSGSNY